MPPFMQSASWQGLIRQAGRLLVRAGTKPPKAKSPLLRQIKHVLQTTFPSTSTPAHLLELAPARLPRADTAFTRAQQLQRARHALTQASRGFRTSARRPAVPAPMNVGLGTARNFSTGGGAGPMNAKIPMAMRALSSLIDSDVDVGLPKPTIYNSYEVKHHVRVSSKIAGSKIAKTSTSIESTRRAFEKYFTPAQPTTQDVASTSNLLRPEDLVTAGVNTTLTIPLAPSYHSIFDLPPAEPFRPDQLGVDRFASLLRGVMTLHDIIDNRASHFVIPLINKLDSLGLTDAHGGCEMHVSHANIDGYAIPESISIKLFDRSVQDVRTLLGESLRQAHEGDWWILTEHRLNNELTPSEARAMLEQWDGHTVRQPIEVDTSQLVMPLIDVDEPVPPPRRWDGNSDSVDSITASWSDTSTPSSLLDDSPALNEGSIYSTDSGSLFSEMLSSQLEELRDSRQSSHSDAETVLTLAPKDLLFDAAQQEWQEV